MRDKTINRVSPPTTDELIVQSLAKLDQVALGVALGTIFGLIIFAATNILLLKGGENVGANLYLLSQYFIGYDITFIGSLIGLFYGFVTGFICGWLIAFLRNFAINLYLLVLRLKSSFSAVNDYIDHP